MSFRASVREDIDSVLARDPAATSRAMVVLCYPGLWAVWVHRISHRLWTANWKLAARVLSQMARFCTGVEIHPGAELGRRLLIDHGMGVVIGETAIVGDDVTLYQGVTLGGTGNERGKRHPTLRDRVFVGNNANILGNITVGENSRVGAGSVVLQDVPPDSTAVGVPAHVIYQDGKRVLITDPAQIKDPLSGVIKSLAEEVKRLRARVDCLDGQLEQTARELDSVRSLATEEEEREQYRSELSASNPYVSMGEGI
ncbi:serine O-acetyltransferase [Paracidobacterium acidisoli]|uniref:Serine acetyltransferase n=1 Tax=Paracidobacterium acidisoli TaxID=2303751 RepID=A0A372IWD9_9BACT|nr:serine O-acetyltransferase [Paracidobacterium acidisoli]